MNQDISWNHTLFGELSTNARHCSVQIYSPSRPPPASFNTLEELAAVTKTVAQGLGEVVNPLYLQDIEDMKPCSGAVVQKGLEKVAVYVDEKGAKHAYRAVCPHLGCLVQVQANSSVSSFTHAPFSSYSVSSAFRNTIWSSYRC